MIPFRCSFSMVNSTTFGAVLGKSRAMVRARFIKYLACEGWIHSFNRWRLAYIVVGTLGECLGAEPNVYFHGIIRVKTRLHLYSRMAPPSCWWWFVRKTPVTFFFLLANSFAVNNCSAPKNKVSPNERIICLFSEKKKRSKSDAKNRFFFGEKCSKTSVAGTPLNTVYTYVIFRKPCI